MHPGALFHITAALVVSLLCEFAVELAVLHLTTALVHRLARFTASELLPGAKCSDCENRKSETNAKYHLFHVITSSHCLNIDMFLGTNFRNNIVTRSEQVGMALIRNCKRRSSHRPSALISHHRLDNRKRKDKHSSAWFLRPHVHTADK